MFIHKKCPPFSDLFPLAHLMDTLLPYSINGNMIYVSSLFESLNRLPIIYNDKKRSWNMDAPARNKCETYFRFKKKCTRGDSKLSFYEKLWRIGNASRRDGEVISPRCRCQTTGMMMSSRRDDFWMLYKRGEQKQRVSVNNWLSGS